MVHHQCADILNTISHRGLIATGQFQRGIRQGRGVQPIKIKSAILQVYNTAKCPAHRGTEVKRRAGQVFRHIQCAVAGQGMIKQRDVNQVQSGTRDIHRHRISNRIIVGQRRIRAARHLQYPAARHRVTESAAKAAQCQRVLCTRQCHTGIRPQIGSCAHRQFAVPRQSILAEEVAVSAGQRSIRASGDVHRRTRNPAKHIGNRAIHPF
ncbi:Uncharacterised protein [Yersinia kristensenii]|nr:Uncharacterised protein [Yersinia kristensenii]